MRNKTIGILGGGLSALAAADILSSYGFDVTVYEADSDLGGVASNFKLPDGRIIPKTYHQIVGTDDCLLNELKRLGLYDKIKWKKTKIKFHINGQFLDLSNPVDLLRYEGLSLINKIRFALFGVRCILKKRWAEYENYPLSSLIEKWAGTEVHENIFKRLVEIKYGIQTDRLSAAWLGLRLSKREAKTKFGYIPNTSWTYELITAYRFRLERNNVKILLCSKVEEINIDEQGINCIKVNGEKKRHDFYISTIDPQELYNITDRKNLLPDEIKKIQYISSISLVAAVDKEILSDYWTIAFSPEMSFGGCFVNDLLNDTYRTREDRSVITCFRNIPYGTAVADEEIFKDKVLEDLQKMVRSDIKFNWYKVFYIKATAPVFDLGYKNIENQFGNLFFAGIYNTYPLLSSTGTAIYSGKRVAIKIIEELKDK